MTDEEVNYTIHKYVNDNSEVYKEFKVYTKSLDALVPVWRKLKKDCRFWGGLIIYSCIVDGVGDSFEIESNNQDKLYIQCESEDKETIQQAAAHATAKAILELKEDNGL